MAKMKVLVTGMNGRIGGALLKYLGKKYDFTALNRRPMEGVPSVTADITDFETIRPHFDGQDAVVHLAASLSEAEDVNDLLRPNIWGAYHIFEAARQAGVRRVIFASSGSVILGYAQESPFRELENGEYSKLPVVWPLLTHESAVRPNSLYGCSKIWGEALGRYYHDSYGLSVICVRFGWVPANDRPGPAPRTYSVWCSHRDAAQMVDKCLTAPEGLGFDIVFAVSDNKYSYRDVTHAREVVGYEPQDRAEDYR